jgi:hypothetical protein
VLIVTQRQLLLAHFTAPFPSINGYLLPDHLKLFRAHLESGSITRRATNLTDTRVLRSKPEITVSFGSESIIVRKSVIRLDDNSYGNIYESPGLDDIQREVGVRGATVKVTPRAFIAALRWGRNPVPEEHLDSFRYDRALVSQIVSMILAHDKRDAIVEHFSCLLPSVRALLEDRMRNRGELVDRIRAKMRMWGAVTITLVVVSCFLSAEARVLALCGAGMSTCVIISSAVDLRRSLWCRKTFKDGNGSRDTGRDAHNY